jgi:hypothetical protein
MNYMRNQCGFLLLGDQRPLRAANAYGHLYQLSLTAWAKHLAKVSRARGAAHELPDMTNAHTEGQEVRRPR